MEELNPRATPEEQYAEYLRGGDLAALGDLFDDVAPELARLARRLAPDRSSAEDLVQETFLTAIERPGSYDPARPLLPWLLGILAHRAREARRRDGRTPEADRLPERSVPEPDAALADAELRASIEEAVDELPDNLRGAVRGRLLEERGTADVARELGITPGALRVRLTRGLARLREVLPAGLASLWALMLGHSVSGVGARGLARVRERVLAEATQHVATATGTSAVSVAGASGAAGAGVVMANKKLVVVAGAVVLAAVGLRTWAAMEPARDPEPAPLHAEALLDAAELHADSGPARASEPTAAAARTPAVASEPASTAPATVVVTVRHADGATLPAELAVHAAFWPVPDGWDRTVELALEDNGVARVTLPAGARLQRVVADATATTTPASTWIDAVLAAGELREVELSVHGGATLAGVVLDEQGRSVAGARVEAWCDRDMDGPPDRVVLADDRGSFLLEHLGPLFVAQASTEGLAPAVGLRGELEPGREVRGMELVVSPAAALRGRVLEPSGAPASGAEVNVHSGLNTRSERDATDEPGVLTFQGGGGSALADAGGRFVVEGLPARSRFVEVFHAEFLAHRAYYTPGGEPAEITLDGGLTLTGTVLEASGRPAAGARVTYGPYSGNVNRAPRVVETDGAGRFELRGLVREPRHMIGVSAVNWRGVHWLGVTHAGHAAELLQPLPPDSDGELVVRLAPEHVIAGRVVDGAGEPVQGAALWLDGGPEIDLGTNFSGRWNTPLHWVDAGAAETRADGSFLLDRLPPGAYTLHLHPDGSTTTEVTLDVATGDTDIEVVLDDERRRGVELRGRVRDAFTGEPIEEFELVVWRGETGRIHGVGDAQGGFSLPGLSPGELGLAVQARGYAERREPTREFDLGVHEFDMALLPSRTLIVEVVDPLGEPFDSAQLEVFSTDGEPRWIGDPAISQSTSASAHGGRAVLSGLPAEPLRIRVRVDGIEHEAAGDFAVDLTTPHVGPLTLVVDREEFADFDVVVVVLGDAIEDAAFHAAVAEMMRTQDGAWWEAALERGDISFPLEEVSLEVLDASGRLRQQGRLTPVEGGGFQFETGHDAGSVSYSATGKNQQPQLQLSAPVGKIVLRARSDMYRAVDLSLELGSDAESKTGGPLPTFLLLRRR